MDRDRYRILMRQILFAMLNTVELCLFQLDGSMAKGCIIKHYVKQFVQLFELWMQHKELADFSMQYMSDIFFLFSLNSIIRSKVLYFTHFVCRVFAMSSFANSLTARARCNIHRCSTEHGRCYLTQEKLIQCTQKWIVLTEKDVIYGYR